MGIHQIPAGYNGGKPPIGGRFIQNTKRPPQNNNWAPSEHIFWYALEGALQLKLPKNLSNQALTDTNNNSVGMRVYPKGEKPTWATWEPLKP